MPFKSQAQRRKIYAVDPKLAREFEAKTPKGKKLPEKVPAKKKSK
jgi:hypothetical protein